MKKDDINCILRPWITQNLSPKDIERSSICSTYQEIKDILGDQCILMGSYARFTSITPVKDIDILYRLPIETTLPYSPLTLLQKLQRLLESGWKDKLNIPIFTVQSHSLKMEFANKHFTVDIVPAITLNEKNEFGDSIFLVPEIANFNHVNRQKYYQANLKTNTPMGWKRSDPLGYISETTLLNQTNSDFRKAIKVIKTWNTHCKKQLWNDNGFKSFHLERFLFNIFQQTPSLSLIESLFKFFYNFKRNLEQPSIRDRANTQQYIDEYLSKFDEQQRILFRQQIDVALFYIEQIGREQTKENVEKYLNDLCYPIITNCRDSLSEQFLFDLNIQTFIVSNIILDGHCVVKPQYGRQYILDGKVRHSIPQKAVLYFYCGSNAIGNQYWKVKNDTSLPPSQIRGEITERTTRHYPEHTLYIGHHFVKCYLVQSGICIAERHFDVTIR